MKKIMTFSLMTFLVVLTGCATRPDKTEIDDASPSAYENYDCDRLVSDAVQINLRLAGIYDSLKGKANSSAYSDGAGIAAAIFPSLLFFFERDGPEVREYRRLEGEYEAIKKTAIGKKCPLDPI